MRGRFKTEKNNVFILVDECILGRKLFIVFEILSKKKWRHNLGIEYKMYSGDGLHV